MIYVENIIGDFYMGSPKSPVTFLGEDERRSITQSVRTKEVALFARARKSMQCDTHNAR